MTRSQKLASFIAHHSFVSCYEPTKVEEALKDPDWINAMHEELNNFTRNEVWTLEERPKGARVIGTKWVFITEPTNYTKLSKKIIRQSRRFSKLKPVQPGSP